MITETLPEVIEEIEEEVLKPCEAFTIINNWKHCPRSADYVVCIKHVNDFECISKSITWLVCDPCYTILTSLPGECNDCLHLIKVTYSDKVR